MQCTKTDATFHLRKSNRFPSDSDSQFGFSYSKSNGVMRNLKRLCKYIGFLINYDWLHIHHIRFSQN